MSENLEFYFVPEVYTSMDQDFPPPPPPDDMAVVDDQSLSLELPDPTTPDSPNDIAQEVTSYSSGDIEVQQTTSTMVDGMQLPVGGLFTINFLDFLKAKYCCNYFKIKTNIFSHRKRFRWNGKQ